MIKNIFYKKIPESKKKLMGTYIGYYALLCKCGEGWNDAMVCGIYATKEEAKKVYNDIKDCQAEHKIVKCSFDLYI